MRIGADEKLAVGQNLEAFAACPCRTRAVHDMKRVPRIICHYRILERHPRRQNLEAPHRDVPRHRHDHVEERRMAVERKLVPLDALESERLHLPLHERGGRETRRVRLRKLDGGKLSDLGEKRV